MAFTLYPFIIATKWERQQPVLMNHEKIHLAQQKELFCIPFLFLFYGHSIYLLFKYFSLKRAYLLNRFELEAFANESDMLYLEKRKRFAWTDKNARMQVQIHIVKSQPIKLIERIGAAIAILYVLAVITIIALLIMFA